MPTCTFCWDKRRREETPLKMRAALCAVGVLLAVPVEGRHKRLNPAMPPRDARFKNQGKVSGSPCDATIPGSWTGSFPPSPPLGDQYFLNWTEPFTGAWTATMVQGGGWTTGAGQFSPDNRTASIAFDTGVKLTGNVSANCSDITWDNDSLWQSVPTPVPITDVHIIAMNHLDVGYNGIPELGLINNSALAGGGSW